MSALADAPLVLDLRGDISLVRVARLVASSVATDAGFDLDELDDLRLAVGELVTAAVGAVGGDGRVTLDYRFDDSGVSVRGRCAGVATLDVDDIARGLLDRSVDRWSVETDDTGATFVLTKLRTDVA